MSCLDRPIPIFPLPNLVLMPGTVLPLQLFERRYRDLIADEIALAEDDRFICMALLHEGHESSYYTHHAPIHPTLCLGQIIKIKTLANGRSFIELLGLSRMTVRTELYDRSYRRGYLQHVSLVSDLLPDEESVLRAQLTDLGTLPDSLGSIAREILGQSLDLASTVDQLAHHLIGPEAWSAKQMLLEETRLDYRIRILLTLYQRNLLRGNVTPVQPQWPPPPSDN